MRAACAADTALARSVALELATIRPDLHSLIGQASGIADLPAPSGLPDAALAFGGQAEPWLRGEPSPLIRPGKVLRVEGNVTRNGEPVSNHTKVLKVGDIIKTGGDGRIMFKAGAGVVAGIPPGSEVILVEMSSRWGQGKLQESKTLLEAKRGEAFLSVAKDAQDKAVAEVKTTKGTAKAGGQQAAKN